MRRHLIHFLLVALLSVCSAATAFAQTTVKGQVVDAESSDPLIGAAVIVVGTTQGTVTDVDGKFTLNASPNATLSIKYLGYKELKKKVTKSGQVNLGTISLEIDAVALADVTITSSIAVARKTPVALSTIDPVYISEKLGTQEFPEILKSTPGVYATKQGGGYGDSDISMRGFESPNIAIMINGVPMNDMEWGGVYWSNWAGLSDVTRSMQTQRGLGASKVSAPSVGGSINIITDGIDTKKGGMVSYGMGNDGYNKVLFSVSTGLTKTGWAMTVMGGKTWGDGYIQGTDFVGYNYFLNISKRINDNHQISLTAFGAPQIHNQRSAYDGLSIKGWQEVKNYMEPGDEYKYNPTYGFGKNGERKTSAKNKYHKPQISLNHMWQIDNTSSLSTALYLSIGDGWGYSGQGVTSSYSSAWYGSSNGVLNTTYRNPDGTFAYDQIQEMNENSLNGSQMVMSVSKNKHKWFGLLSTYTKELNDKINFYAGFDGRYYIGTHTNEINDLYDGAYYIDRYRATVDPANNSAAASPDFATKKLGVGDVVYRDYDGYVVQEGVFAQAEYNVDKLSAFVAGSVNNTSQWRYDRFYYDKQHAKSAKVNSIGFTVKGGANYNLNENHNVFANIGYISRAPFFSGGAFLSSTVSNVVNKNAVNEKIFSVELGYGYHSRFLNANLNVYHTAWNDKSMARSMDYTDADGNTDRAMINMTGVDATHEGVELDFTAKPLGWLDITGMFSMGNWRWTNDPTGYFYNSGGQPLTVDKTVASGIGAPDHAKMVLLLDGVKVGGAAQTTAALGAKVKLSRDLHFGIDWNLFARNYADWAMASTDLSLGGTKTFVTPWRIPSANTFDFNASYSFKIGTLPAVLSGNVDNLFDQEYISSAYDGDGHDWESAYRVFYGFGRTMSMRLKVNF
ncbi:TonB-dependent receptor [uncultured Bacteroides sp.]|uniref:TonB-dependent receptor n=1 Tax=uncultured Bacteroides sp. TaxID=162156 RepID=UPI002AA9448E|nr:TonB-dependent receptor [uncultured Bacteroides sp.]